MIRFTNIGTDSDRYGFDGHGRMSRVAGTDRRWRSGSSTMSSSTMAGHKRYATQNAKFLMHDGSNLIWNSGTKAQDQMEFQKRVEQRIKQYVIAHSNVTSEEYDSKLRVEWYLFADEAKEKGFCDHILGVDCDMDEIV